MVGKKLRCPNCGAVNPTAATPAGVLRCWLCTEPFQCETAEVADEEEHRERSPLERQGTTFGLTTIILVVTIAAIGFGIFRRSPAFGILFLVLLSPALVRTQVFASRRARSGVPLTKLQRFEMFVTSFSATLGVLFVITIAAIIAFLGTCFFLITQY